jgi:hypothetical protein
MEAEAVFRGFYTPTYDSEFFKVTICDLKSKSCRAKSKVKFTPDIIQGLKIPINIDSYSRSCFLINEAEVNKFKSWI